MKNQFSYRKDKTADDDGRNIYTDQSKGPILYRIFDIYEQKQNIIETAEEINNRFADDLGSTLARNRVRTVLTDCVDHLPPGWACDLLLFRRCATCGISSSRGYGW
jgi:hypothetical protein